MTCKTINSDSLGIWTRKTEKMYLTKPVTGIKKLLGGELTAFSRTKLVLHIIISSIQQSLCVCEFCHSCLVLAWTQGTIFFHNGQTLCRYDFFVSTQAGTITCFPVLVLAGTQLSVSIDVVRYSTTVTRRAVLLPSLQNQLAPTTQIFLEICKQSAMQVPVNPVLCFSGYYQRIT